MASEKSAARAFATLSTDFFVLGMQIKSGQVDLPSCEALRQRVLLLFESIERKSPQYALAHGDVEDARYALAAYLDEMIQYSQWQGRHEWAQNPLQAILFDESRAGTGFFERLKLVHQRQSPALGVYFNCLALGFAGECRFGDMAEHDRLLREISKDIGRKHKVLAIHGKRPDTAQGSRRGLSLGVLGGVAVGLAGLVALLLYGILWWQSSAVTKALAQMLRG